MESQNYTSFLAQMAQRACDPKAEAFKDNAVANATRSSHSGGAHRAPPRSPPPPPSIHQSLPSDAFLSVPPPGVNDAVLQHRINAAYGVQHQLEQQQFEHQQAAYFTRSDLGRGVSAVQVLAEELGVASKTPSTSVIPAPPPLRSASSPAGSTAAAAAAVSSSTASSPRNARNAERGASAPPGPVLRASSTTPMDANNDNSSASLPPPPLVPRNFVTSSSVPLMEYNSPANPSSNRSNNNSSNGPQQKRMFSAFEALKRTPVPGGGSGRNNSNDTSLMSTTPLRSFSPGAANSRGKHAVNADEIEEQIMMSPSSPVHRASLAANVERSAIAQRKKLSEFERTLDEAQKLNVLEQRLTDHQNDHTKLRAQRLLDIDKSRWEVQRCDFRVVEVQAQMEAACTALQERLLSRVATIKQLQEDSIRQSEHRLRSEVRGEHDRHIAQFREQASQRTATVESLSVALQQLTAHVEVQCASLEHELASNSNHDRRRSNSTSSGATDYNVNAALDKLVALRHSIDSDAQRQTASVESMVTMIDSFSVDARRQLAELKQERTAFQDRMTRRLEEMRSAKLTSDARSARTGSSTTARGGGRATSL